MDRLFDAAVRTEGYRLQVDLEGQVLTKPDGSTIEFDCDPALKHRLLNGLDDIGVTLQSADEIRTYEQRRAVATPWLFTDI